MPSSHIKLISSYFERSGERNPKQRECARMQAREVGVAVRVEFRSPPRDGHTNHLADLVAAR
jgi:hypothetical protein